MITLKFSFRTKIYTVIISILLMFGIVLSVIVSEIVTDSLLEENKKRGIAIAVNLAARIREPILAMDFLRMNDLLDEVARLSDDVSYTFILDKGKETLVHSFKGGFPVELKMANIVPLEKNFNVKLLNTGKELIYDFAVPIFIGGDRFGAVHIGISRTKVQETINRLLRTIFLATGFVIIIAGFVGTFFARTVTKRINILRRSSEEAVKGNLDAQTAPLLKQDCWEIMSCDKKQCPAYGDTRRRCWYLAGTMCPTCVAGDYAQKIDTCRKCKVYRKNAGDEIQHLAESFDVMALSLNEHISGLKETEERLRQQSQLLQTILDATPDIVCLQDRESIYRAVNKAFCKFISKEEKDVIGKTDFELFPRDLAEKNHEENLRVMETGKPFERQDEVQAAKGKKWFHVVKIPVYDTDGNVTGILWSGRDITELKEIQARLVQSQKMESIGQLAAGIAHEINTPIGIILGYAQLLLEEAPEGGDIYEGLQTIEKQSKICRRIVADLLRFSRHTESTVTSVDINQCIEEVVSVVEHTFKLERVTIKRDYDANLPPVKGDKEKLKQVFVNLLNNAHDAIGTDGTITITTSFDKKNSELVISMADTGRGIPPEKIDKIFDPFFTTKAVGKGTGLGLSVTFGIIQEHGGRIEVQSPPLFSKDKEGADAGGAVFIIYLPVSEITGLENKKGETGDGKNIGVG
ncbi:MAG: PAS domain-containing sensor histidine kinase [Deltaproteobacteria bacterium]|nr:MAG: PAS domain-containing sensor histidine kinase [Deltaproteobacteria bacterium]